MVDLLRQQSARFGERTAFEFLDDHSGTTKVSFQELDLKAKAIAVNLKNRGLEPGDRALLIYPAGLEFISAFFGCLYE